MIFAYWLEDNPAYADRVTALLDKMQLRGDILCTSVFTLGEVLTGPYKRGAVEVANQIIEAIRPPFVELIPFEPATAQSFARIRAAHPISAMDAIHLASAGQARVSLFLTNDRA